MIRIALALVLVALLYVLGGNLEEMDGDDNA